MQNLDMNRWSKCQQDGPHLVDMAIEVIVQVNIEASTFDNGPNQSKGLWSRQGQIKEYA